MRMSQHAARMLHVATFVATASIGVVLVRPDLAAHAPLVSSAAAQSTTETVGDQSAPPPRRGAAYPVLGSYPLTAAAPPSDDALFEPPAATATEITPAETPRPAPSAPPSTVVREPAATFAAARLAAAPPAAGAFPFPAGPASLQDKLPQPEPIDGSRVLARVGSEVVLAVELLPQLAQIDAMLDQQKLSPIDRAAQRKALMSQALDQAIDAKLLFLAAKRDIPAENFPQVEENVGGFFEENQIPEMVKRIGAKDRAELELRLQEQGEDLTRIKRRFVEEMIGVSFRDQALGNVAEIPYADLIEQYERRTEEFEVPASVRWRRISVTYGPDADLAQRQQAWSRICEAGNRVLGTAGRPRQPFEQVAQEFSDGFQAAAGGVWDWTQRDALTSQKLNDALFALPIGRPSQIIEDENAYHIVEVLERREAGRRSFLEVQSEIREELVAAEQRRRHENYLRNLRRESPVVTIFDDERSQIAAESAAAPPRR